MGEEGEVEVGWWGRSINTRLNVVISHHQCKWGQELCLPHSPHVLNLVTTLSILKPDTMSDKYMSDTMGTGHFQSTRMATRTAPTTWGQYMTILEEETIKSIWNCWICMSARKCHLFISDILLVMYRYPKYAHTLCENVITKLPTTKYPFSMVFLLLVSQTLTN